MVENNQPADVVTIADSIERSEDKDKTGGPPTSRRSRQNTPSAINVRRYAQLVRDRSVQRRLGQVATEIAESALALAGKEVGQLLDEADRRSSRSPSRAPQGSGPARHQARTGARVRENRSTSTARPIVRRHRVPTATSSSMK